MSHLGGRNPDTGALTCCLLGTLTGSWSHWDLNQELLYGMCVSPKQRLSLPCLGTTAVPLGHSSSSFPSLKKMTSPQLL